MLTGTMLGPYRIEAKLGAGGMGEVYKARDTRLDRTVAIKVLPPELSADPERRARFEREARAVASLSHPHICALFDIGEAVFSSPESPPSPNGLPAGFGAASLAPVHYLVMEHLQGETLADRLAHRDVLPLAQAIDIATQIADALDAAHKHGIVHRDLKPGNVMLTTGGTGKSGVASAKLLDFGLAKLAGHGEQPAMVSATVAPTEAAPVTAKGTILGTLQYMAPEQLEGKEADARTDLWALGAILYEMLTGKRAFAGDSQASLIGSIMNAEPAALATLQPLAPPSLERVVKKCLAKHPDDRWDGAHDVADELRWIAQASAASSATEQAPGRRARRRWLTAVAALAVAAAALAGFGAAWFMRPAPEASPPVRVTVPVSPATELMTIMLGRTAFAWTPDGRALVFAGLRDDRRHLYVRPIDAGEARELPNTEDARVLAISPDGRWVAFWSAPPGAPGAIKKVPLAGGPAMTLASGVGLREAPWGLAWADTGRLFFAAQSSILDGIWEVLPDGTTKAMVRLAEGELQHALPFALPGGNTLLYTVRKHSRTWGGEQVLALTLATGARKVVVNDAIDARYVPTGHLLFLRMGALYAVPFDPVRLEVTGKEAPVLDPVAQAVTPGDIGSETGAGQFAVSPRGALACVQSPIVPLPESRIVALDRRGQVTTFDAPSRSFSYAVRVSPDGTRLAVVISTVMDVGLWLYDFDSTRLNLFAGGEEARWPLWSRDGKSLYYLRVASGRYEVAVRAFDGSAPRRVVGDGLPSSVTPDGRQLAFDRAQDILTIDLDGEKAAERQLIVDPNTMECSPEFSPDGRWLAYASNRSGRYEVYVRPYPGPGADEQVSVDGGDSPAWNPNGRELFFVALANAKGQRTMMSAAFRAGSPPGRPQRLFEYDAEGYLVGGRWLRAYDVARDGERFYALQRVPVEPRPPVTHISLVLNWFEELKAKVPAGAAK